MSTYNFNAPVTGQVQMGDHNTMNVNQQAEAVLALSKRLVDELARVNSPLRSHAEEIRGELIRSDQEGSAPDTGRIRRRLELISAGVGAGSGLLALVQGIAQAVGIQAIGG
ncbi:hypothetical protein [Streptomyces sp. NPDC001348]